jgi:hypothetical protein
MPKKDNKIWLSHSGIEGMRRCPRCFWLQYKKGIRQPEGIVSRLANRFDKVIKNYFDIYREIGELPPMVEGQIEGKLEKPFTEIYFYHHDDKYGFYGKLDDCLVTQEEKYTPIDFKTSSSDPREKEILSAYQSQLDAYSFLLEANKKKTAGIGHLIYFYPQDSKELHDGFPMLVFVQTLKTNPENAKRDLLEAIEFLEKDIPAPSKDCPFCGWYDKVKGEFK